MDATRLWYAVEINWSKWFLGFEIAKERHWSRNATLYQLTFFLGPLGLGIDYAGKPKKVG